MPGGPPYSLGIDLGSSFVAAAAVRAGRVEVLPLGKRSELLPAVVGWQDGLMLGEAADRLSLHRPDAVLHGLKGRIGDPLPVRLGGAPRRIEALLVPVLASVAAAALRRFGAPPATVALTHPAGWGPFRLEALTAAAAGAGLRDVRLVADPVAAATAYLRERPVREGRLLAVHDFGGHTFQATVLRRTLDGVQIVGSPQGFVDLGGVDLDERVFRFVRRAAGDALERLDARTPDSVAAAAVVRRECRTAKERLSRSGSTTILAHLPSGEFVPVPLSRDRFEELVRSRVLATVEALGELLDATGVEAQALDATILVGGSSRIPLVSGLLTETLGARPATVADPKLAVAVGAALSVADGGAAPAGAEDGTRVVPGNRPGTTDRPARWWRRRPGG